ncbi:MAG TPA: F0F1 ATP synthase subunit alpha, partial [Candidatus Latescibacteria bacterium]|nr:F0F1 ATP synthase subunit alpha [Candidatus Latescibacterota bacterium]
KQDQFQPLSLGEQVFSLTVGVNVDDIPVQDISRFEQEVLSQARNLHQDLLDEISSSGEASDEAMATIEAAIEKVKAGFQASE